MITDSDEMQKKRITTTIVVRTETMAPIIVSKTEAIAEMIELMP